MEEARTATGEDRLAVAARNPAEEEEKGASPLPPPTESEWDGDTLVRRWRGEALAPLDRFPRRVHVQAAREARTVLAVVVSGCAGYAHYPDPEAAMEGIGKSPDEASDTEKYAVRCFLREAGPRDMDNVIAGREAEPYDLARWLHAFGGAAEPRTVHAVVNLYARPEARTRKEGGRT